MMNFELCHKMKKIEASYSWYSYGAQAFVIDYTIVMQNSYIS